MLTAPTDISERPPQPSPSLPENNLSPDILQLLVEFFTTSFSLYLAAWYFL